MTQPTHAACDRVLKQISAYLDGDLDRTACDAIEQHSATCSRCSALVDGLRRTVGLCRQAGASPLPESVRRRARESIRHLLEHGERGD